MPRPLPNADMTMTAPPLARTRHGFRAEASEAQILAWRRLLDWLLRPLPTPASPPSPPAAAPRWGGGTPQDGKGGGERDAAKG